MPEIRNIIKRILLRIGTRHSSLLLMLHVVERVLLCIELADRILKHLR